MAPRTPKKFQEIDGSEDEYTPSESPSPPPPSVEMVEVLVFVKACIRCQKGKRDCEVVEVGAACLSCKGHNYKCDKTDQTDMKTMWVRRPAKESDVVVVVEEDRQVDRKGKKRQAESPVAVKPKKVRVKVEKAEKVEKPRATKAEKAEKSRATKSKGKAKQRAPKTSLMVVDSSEAEEAMEVDESEPEVKSGPKPKRARLVKGK